MLLLIQLDLEQDYLDYRDGMKLTLSLEQDHH